MAEEQSLRRCVNVVPIQSLRHRCLRLVSAGDRCSYSPAASKIRDDVSSVNALRQNGILADRSTAWSTLLDGVQGYCSRVPQFPKPPDIPGPCQSIAMAR
ncbi:hypothetical protein CMQ_7127 [Grosmannia clavigera kw1407]|uniref:Uncharacterized protein n=1 Tax=Grosmannia clavigera (strain kw1407 / UAMH 11150) TaxID=655863 RepID=F0XNX8_GROCL|nr:uncharacterized protein CMQ_7127 [Grosmannia clavigera kw1407]EFX00125.1 hypothetical protein CMQ_7127 [Grosmannia clavigera kw1407]